MHGFLKTVKLCKEIGYIYRGLEALKQDIVAMIKKENFVYEDE